MSTHRSSSSLVVSVAVGALVLLVGLALIVVAGASGPAVDASAGADAPQVSDPTSENETPSEAPYEESVPEPGDPYFEAAAADGSWVSYDNPRDEYRNPYLGDGSGKLCVMLVNENGDPVVGESVPNTTVRIPTGDAIEWHTGADPLTVAFPLTDHYDRPLDADQFGTADDVAQGDGILDAHCIEFHGLPEDESITYDEVEIDGEHADSIDVVGYVQQENEAWNTSVDPIADAESYETAGGGWTYEPGGSHGQAVAVLQLDGTAENASDGGGGGSASEDDDTDPDGTDDDANSSTGATVGDEVDRMPGFAPVATLLAIALAIGLARLR